jgi:hypothetical protein
VLTRLVCLYLGLLVLPVSSQQPSPLPSGPLVFGGLAGEFRADGTFTISGTGWPTLVGTWKAADGQVELALAKPAGACAAAARYRVAGAGTTRDIRSDRGHVSATPHDARSQHLAAGRREADDSGSDHHAHSGAKPHAVTGALMATPALSGGAMFVRSSQSVIAIGRR